MTLITDGLLIAAAVFAGTYCFVLSRRLRALKDLDTGLGAAITRMTRALEDARRTLEEAKSANRDGNKDLKDLIVRAEAASGQLRILLTATRDLPSSGPARPAAKPSPATRDRQEDEREAPEATKDHERRPAAPVARREPLPIAAPRPPAPALDALERAFRPPASSPPASTPPACTAPAPTGWPLRRQRPPAPAEEDELLAALADFADART